ncbi:phosphatidylserine decarboxylase proenzyme, mitochondrial-like isoform X2 [Orbicella faveolata]|uniref:phosphatidylserine decarboxylase proenzyme, mitochondrial-like isoform X1 n=1 Tax=Orbicella faveolata TaxID=48498 RepID=UPI0009E2572D|nr:phosphatidylserine decarboxylase proenzyme, mitochondrial-like isoform X1 [Orbicella faveolata]XP_020607782.1 phosphatidylserine decarboxylase proenzyme, mitochondrial-like isoform X2 [Orbicella faveolata]
MRLHADDEISFAGYRHLNDLRHDSTWIMSCVLYAHSAICLVVVVAFASYGLVWPVRNKSETLLHRTTRKGAKRLGTAVRSYFGTLRWFSIPASVGFAYVCYQQFWHIKEREKRKLEAGESVEPSQWQVALFKKLPTRVCSRAWGKVCDVDLPLWLRKPILGSFSWYFACNVAEAVEEELVNYPSLGAFFRRQLKPDARKICDASSVVSPADGTVLHFGEVENDMVEQVKGITYSMKTFLGPDQPSSSTLKELASNNNKSLYHCVIYLGPGDYHSFHSPSEWNVKLRRHFPGDLFSVHPGIAQMVAGLFNHNERVVLSGSWKHGFFSFTAVGAYNVGSINLKFDKDLKTNCAGRYSPGSFHELEYLNDKPEGVPLVRGERMGAFNLGSTIVLIFEAPKDFEFHVQAGQKLKYGEPVGLSREEAE